MPDGMQVVSENRGFLAWWQHELTGIFRAGKTAAAAKPRARLVLAYAGGAAQLFEERDQGRTSIGLETTTAELTESDLETVRAKLRRRRPLPLGIRLTKAQCFERRVTLPTAARDGFARILSLHIERATPFRRADVYDAFIEDKSARAPNGQTALRHVIVKRALIDEPVRMLAGRGLPVAFADCWDDTGLAPLDLDFLSAAREESAPRQERSSVNRLLTLAAVGLLSAAAYLAIAKREAALAEIDAELSAARTRTQALRSEVAKAEKTFEGAAALAALARRTPNPVGVIEDLSRLLPDGAYLTELQIKDGRVTFAGLAEKATELVALVEASSAFEGAEMTAPVMLDAGSGKDQFRMSARLTAANLARADAAAADAATPGTSQEPEAQP